ncbi:cupin domain-containing protein [Zobellia alginiliquefaciens]|uniref:cupin domain-containing protein n=1 Tax=Zobellia alginiliquefaciens TaxID=3032586 RepID=UPI0023E15189|nr:cupin domain-containing protein [Zobellia alginiliquefaciens]
MMQKRIFYTVMVTLLVFTSCTEKKASVAEDISIFPDGRKIDNDNFTGTAWLTMLAESDSLNAMYAGNVRFEPGTRTNWHSHPTGQLLIAIDGEGYYQEKGQAKRILRKGDAVKCPPNTPHWHGASPDSDFSHIAVSSSENGPTQWFEPVSELEYEN